MCHNAVHKINLIKSFFSVTMKESTTSIIAWFTQPDILRPMIGGGGEVFQPDMYKPYMTIGILWAMPSKGNIALSPQVATESLTA